MSDRTVHAESASVEIVRYDRAGKWYIEPLDDRPRRQVSLTEAAQYAQWAEANTGATVREGLPGGAAFDRKMRLLRAWSDE